MADDKVTFTAPHFSEMGLYLAAERTDPDVTENRTVTVTVDKTDSDTITGANYAGDTYVTENPDIAAVTVTGTDEQKESYNPEKAMAGTWRITTVVGRKLTTTTRMIILIIIRCTASMRIRVGVVCNYYLLLGLLYYRFRS